MRTYTLAEEESTYEFLF